MAASDHLNSAQFVYASPQRQRQIRETVTPMLPTRGGSVPKATVQARNEGVIRALTFSGVPAEHLQGLYKIKPNLSQPGAHAAHVRKEYRPIGSRPPVESEIRLGGETSDNLTSPDRETRRFARHTLIHELGHHVHAETDPVMHFRGDRGTREAVAENYADTHTARPTAPDIYDQLVAEPGKYHAPGWGPIERVHYKKHREAGTQPNGRSRP